MIEKELVDKINKLNDDFVDFFNDYKDGALDKIDNHLDKLQTNLKKVYKNINKSKYLYFYRTCIIVYDSLSKIDKTNLTLIKINVLRDIIYEIITGLEKGKELFNKVDDMLVENDMDWIDAND